MESRKKSFEPTLYLKTIVDTLRARALDLCHRVAKKKLFRASMANLFSVTFFSKTSNLKNQVLQKRCPSCCDQLLDIRSTSLWLQLISTFLPCRSEEHTSELQSLTNLVCRLL